MRLRSEPLRRIVGLVAVAWISSAVAQDPQELATAAAAIPGEAFFAEANSRAPKLSPDGSRIVYLRDDRKNGTLRVFNRRGEEKIIGLPSSGEPLDDFFWKGNDHLGFYLKPDRWGFVYGGISDLNTGKTRRRDPRHLGWQVINQLHGDPRRILVADENLSYSDLWTGTRRVLFDLSQEDPGFGFRDFVVDGSDNLRLVNRINFRRGMAELLYRDHRNAPWQVVLSEPVNPMRPAVSIV